LSQRPCLARPREIVEQRRQRLDDLSAEMRRVVRDRLKGERNRIAVLSGRLDALSPLRVMGRGFAAVEKLPERRVLRAAAEAQPGDQVAIRFHDGTLTTWAESVESAREES